MFCESHRGLVKVVLAMFSIFIFPLLQVCHSISDEARVAFRQGILFKANEQNDSALVYFNRTLELEPKAVGVYVERGNVYDKLGKADSALADLNKAIDMEPKYGKAYFNRGLAYAHQGDYDKAIADYNKAFEFNRLMKDFFNTYRYMFNSMERMELNNAIDCSLTVFTIGVYLERGDAFQHKGDFGRALADFNSALKLDSKCTETYLHRGSTYETMGDYERALADLNKAVQLNAYFGKTYVLRGSVYFKKGDCDQAITDCNKAIELRPKDANAFYTKGLAYEKKGCIKEAVEAFKYSIQYAPPKDTVLIKQVKLKMSELEK